MDDVTGDDHPSDPGPRGAEPADPDPIGPDPIGPDPIGPDPIGPDPIGPGPDGRVPARPTADDSDTADLAASALAGAQAAARRRPRTGSDGRCRTRAENLAGRRRTGRGRTPERDAQNGSALERNVGGYSGSAPDPARDPAPVGRLLGEYVAEFGWQAPLAQGRLFAEWPAMVGGDIAAHCTPESLTGGELRITAQSTAWATQLRLLSSSLLARLVAELGPDVVTRLSITGPVAPSWRHGPRTVRGRGPRDTYG